MQNVLAYENGQFEFFLPNNSYPFFYKTIDPHLSQFYTQDEQDNCRTYLIVTWRHSMGVWGSERQCQTGGSFS
jgi:hypothetical protein